MTSKRGRGGRRRPPQERKPRLHIAPPPREDDSGRDQELIKGLRRTLRGSEPLGFLAIVSGMLEVTDPRRRNPFAPEQDQFSQDDLVESFVETPYAEATAALTAIRALTTDELLAARIRRELVTRRHPLPDWLAGLDQARVEPDVWFMTHVLGDGDDYLIGVRLQSGHTLSALVYVDHNMGTVVKDAFVVPQPLRELSQLMAQTISDVDQTLSLIDPAMARAVVEEAIAHGALLYPPLESESWPMCRPIVEWMLRMLPVGGVVPERREWTDTERRALADEFFDSPFADGLDDPDNRDLLDSLLWFGTDYGPGDPLRWSPVNVEIILSDWFPRKIVAEPAYLSRLPDLLRAFIRFSHSERGIRASLTEETLQAVDAWEPEYQRVIRSARLQGPAALIAGMLEEPIDDDDFDYAKYMLESLDEAVGGRVQLMALDDEPLPDEAFEWAGVAEDVQPVVREWLEACDRVADELLDDEHRTAMRRFLSRAAVGDPAIFRRKASSARGAAAVAWVIASANDSAGNYSRLAMQDLLAEFGVTGSVSQRAEPLLRANGVDPHRRYGSMKLGAPDLLTSRKRAEIIRRRDEWLHGEG